MSLQAKISRVLLVLALFTVMMSCNLSHTMASDSTAISTEKLNNISKSNIKYSLTAGASSVLLRNLEMLDKVSVAENSGPVVSSPINVESADASSSTVETKETKEEVVTEEQDEIIGMVYVQRSYLNFREEDNTDSEVIDILKPNTRLKVLEKLDNGWYKVKYKGNIGYVYSDYVDEKEYSEFDDYYLSYSGERLNSVNGMVSGPSGHETYYNLNMSGCIKYMKALGFDYEYWVRSDGVKMYGDYVMCAADLSTRPKGTIIETSLGLAMVCDTGSFVNWDSTRLDIAVAW